MTKSKFFWGAQMFFTLFLYAICLYLVFFTQEQAFGGGLLVALLVLHLLEMRTALRIGRERGLEDRKIVAMTLVFGYTWWLPLKRGII